VEVQSRTIFEVTAAPMLVTLINWTRWVAIAAHFAEERRLFESWNKLTIPLDYRLPVSKLEAREKRASGSGGSNRRQTVSIWL
jgi:hypothetical protein